jgi:hypothetical protein
MLGVTLSALYDKCHAEFLVSSIGDLRAQLVEFRTHHLVKTVSGTMKSLSRSRCNSDLTLVLGNGFSELLTCPLKQSELRALLADMAADHVQS